jgi:spermidine synthase
MVSPYAVRLKIKGLQTSGTTVGNLYAISTVGSIAGTFAAGFFLIPVMGTTNILMLLTILLAALSIVLFIAERKTSIGIFPLALMAISSYNLYAFNNSPKPYVDTDTPYSRVWIYDTQDPLTGKPIKFMRINNESSSAMFTDSDELVFPYTRAYRLLEHFSPGPGSILILGGAGYSFPKFCLQRYPHAHVDVVEIDPELTDLAKEHFNLKADPRLRIFHEDARTFLNREEGRYDVIIGDAYKSLYTIPWHLTTVEAAQKAYSMLNENGCMLQNIIASTQGEASAFLRAELATFRKVFPQVYVVAVTEPSGPEGIRSLLMIALKTGEAPSWESSDPELSALLNSNVTDYIFPNLPILTDEFAPVDYYTNKAIQ